MQKTERRQDRRTITELDLTELNSLKPLNNLVLLKKMSDNRRGRFMGQEILLDTSFSPEHYSDVIFEAKAVPKSLVYDARRDEFGNFIEQKGMEWKNRIDLCVGDIVWCNYNQSLNSLKIRCEDDMYQLMHYSHIYLSIRKWVPEDDNCVLFIDPDRLAGSMSRAEAMADFEDTGILAVETGYMPEIKKVEWKKKGTDKQISRTLPMDKMPENVMVRRDTFDGYDEISIWKVIMHNGYILFEEIEKKNNSLFVKAKENIDHFGRVRYMGRPNEEYVDHYTWDDNKVRIGDIIHLSYKFSKKLENNPLIARFGDGDKLHITQRHRILGITTLDQ